MLKLTSLEISANLQQCDEETEEVLENNENYFTKVTLKQTAEYGCSIDPKVSLEFLNRLVKDL